MSDNKEIDGNKVLAIIQRDAPHIIERAVLILRIEELEEENASLKAQ